MVTWISKLTIPPVTLVIVSLRRWLLALPLQAATRLPTLKTRSASQPAERKEQAARRSKSTDFLFDDLWTNGKWNSGFRLSQSSFPSHFNLHCECMMNPSEEKSILLTRMVQSPVFFHSCAALCPSLQDWVQCNPEEEHSLKQPHRF